MCLSPLVDPFELVQWLQPETQSLSLEWGDWHYDSVSQYPEPDPVMIWFATKIGYGVALILLHTVCSRYCVHVLTHRSALPVQF